MAFLKQLHAVFRVKYFNDKKGGNKFENMQQLSDIKWVLNFIMAWIEKIILKEGKF